MKKNHIGKSEERVKKMKVYIFFADGLEEIEGLTVVDLLRRVDIPISIVSITGSKRIIGAHDIKIEADTLFEDTDFTDAAMLILPGGTPGTKNLKAHKGLCGLLRDFHAKGKYIAAICAAPSILGQLNILNGKKATCYPGHEDQLSGAFLTEEHCVTDGNIITSRGMGTAIDFAMEIISVIKDSAVADALKKTIIY